MAIAVETQPEVRRLSLSDTTATPARRNSTLFRRVTAQAMGMEHDSLCHKSHWVPKSSRAACSNCKRAFRVFTAKHHCRLCGEVVCGACSSKRILFQKKSVRSCDECVNQSVESISRVNRRSGSGSSDETVGDHKLPTRKSESDVLSRPSSTEVASRRRGQTTDAAVVVSSTTTSSVSTYKRNHQLTYRPVESWRMQLPYVLVLFLMAVAGVTNVLALTS